MAKRRSTVPKGAAAARPSSQSGRRPSRKQGPPLLIVGGGLIAVAIIVGLVLLVQSNTAQAGTPGERIPIQGADHIPMGASHEPYSSDPPTSGPHYVETLDAGVYDIPQPDEMLVHNLEHGHIVISYDCGRLADCDGTKQQLRRIFDAYNGWKVTIVPRQNADAAIALTAWGWLDKMDELDEARIRRFIQAWRDKGPERTME